MFAPSNNAARVRHSKSGNQAMCCPGLFLEQRSLSPLQPLCFSLLCPNYNRAIIWMICLENLILSSFNPINCATTFSTNMEYLYPPKMTSTGIWQTWENFSNDFLKMLGKLIAKQQEAWCFAQTIKSNCHSIQSNLPTPSSGSHLPSNALAPQMTIISILWCIADDNQECIANRQTSNLFQNFVTSYLWI